ncbi:MAG TPA: CsgG/HfaB family protein, partial [Longimicrobiaceae bacterium]|nr:CsgG/HfaB family protein [Longimicrobiaceae bacterium]
MITLRAAVAVALAAAAVAAAPAQSQPNLPTLAVLDLNDGGSLGPGAQDLTGLGKGLAAMLTTEMSRNPRVRMVERDRIRSLLDEQRLAVSGIADEATAIRVGRLLGAQYMLFGSYADVYGNLRIDVRVVEVETGRLLRAQEVTAPRENLFASVTTLAERTFRDLSLAPPSALAAAARVPAQAALLLSRGLALEDAGDAAGARRMYEEALRLAPEYQAARERLARPAAGPSAQRPAARPSAAPSAGASLDGDLPRVVVAVGGDDGAAGTALSGFLREAGFAVIDPAFARAAGDGDRLARALQGSDPDAVALGRSLGAQVLIVGRAPADAAQSTAEPGLQTGTAQVTVRALRLDEARVVATADVSGRGVDGTPGAAKAKAVRGAVEELVQRTRFLGELVNDWQARPWSQTAYWEPETPSVAAQLSPGRRRGAGDALTLAIIEASAYPDTASARRGIGVVGRVPQRARVRGVVPAAEAQVSLSGVPARVRALTGEEQTRYGLTSAGMLFEGETPLADGQDSVH